MKIRDESLGRLASGNGFDVLVIGGGVNGVAVLRELALNGVSALLVDHGDIARGASGASSRMAHGGLRYLENREFKLVAESTRERNRLLRNAPHFTRPLKVVVPLTSRFAGVERSVARFFGISAPGGALSAAALRGALMLYEFFGRVERALPSHRSPEARVTRPSGLAERYKAMLAYFDARIVNPEGLIFEMIEDALDADTGAACLNHASWSELGDGRFEIVDQLTGARHIVAPRIVVNATGAWIDTVNRQLGLATTYVRPVKGAHLLIRHEALHARMDGAAFYFDDGTGRMVISYPLDRTILLGTTEIAVGNPDDAEIAPAEVDYLLTAISGLFDDIVVGPEHVVALTTGIRPLQNGGGASANRAHRDHAIHEDHLAAGAPVLSLVGGKWTTFRALGAQVADIVFERLGVARTASTESRHFPGAAGVDGLASELVRSQGLDAARADHLVRRYGALATEIAAFCAERPDAPLATLPDYSRREIAWLVTHRSAARLDDLLLRRTQIVLDGFASPDVLAECAALMAEALGAGDDWIEAEIERCRHLATVEAHGPAGPFAREARHG